MCSIFGISFLNGHRLRNSVSAIGTISRLFIEAQTGGRRAAGLSIMRAETAHVMRRPMSGGDLVKTDEYLKFMTRNLELDESTGEENPVISVIGHCRFPTKGDASNNLNNHPIIFKHIIGVHNGVITNDDALFKEFNTCFDRQAEVDTEIIFALISHFTGEKGLPKRTSVAIQKASAYLKGGYACALQNSRQPYHLHLFRRYNPIRVLVYPKLGVVLFATREHFIQDAFEEFLGEDECGTPSEIEMVDGTGLTLNLHDRTYQSFSLERTESFN